MKKTHLIALLATATLALAACNNDNSTPPLTGGFRVVNGVTDSSAMNVDLATVGTANAIPYGNSSATSTVPQGSYDATIKPTGNSAQNYKVTGVPITSDTFTTVLTYGTVANGTASGFKAPQSIAKPTSGTFAVEFLHDAYNESAAAPVLNFYIVTPGAGIAGATPVATTFATPPTNTRVEFPINSGGYELVVTDANGLVVFDSGTTPVQLLTDPDANVLQIAAVDKATGSVAVSPITLLVMDNLGAHFIIPPSA